MLSVYAMSNMCLNCAGVKFSDCLLENSFKIQSLNDLFIEAEPGDEVIDHPSSSLLQTKQLTYRMFSVCNVIAMT